MRPLHLVPTAFLLALALTACERRAEPAGGEPAASAEAPVAEGGVARVVAEPEAPPAPPPAPAAIQTQPGPSGTQVALQRVQVTGDVLTVQLSYLAPDNRMDFHYAALDEVSVIDDATSQRYGVLKDATGKWLASPVDNEGNQLRVETDDGRPTVVWMKFPAPPAGSPTVSINVPEVGPFDGVAVRR